MNSPPGPPLDAEPCRPRQRANSAARSSHAQIPVFTDSTTESRVSHRRAEAVQDLVCTFHPLFHPP